MSLLEDKLKESIAMLRLAEGSVAEYRRQTEAVWLEVVKEKFGVQIGSIVKYKGKRYRVCRITHYDSDLDLSYIPNLYGNPQNMDGKFSIGERQLYEGWEVEKA